MSKEANVYILDMNPLMGEKDSASIISKLEMTQKIIEKLLIEKIISAKKGSLVGIVLLSSSASINREFDSKDPEEDPDDAYTNIIDLNYSEDKSEISDPLKMADLKMLRAIRSISPSLVRCGNLMDAMVVAVKMIVKQTTSKSSGKALKFSKRICVFTDGHAECAPELVDVVLDQCIKNEIASLICGFGFDVQEMKIESPESSKVEATRATLNRFANRTDSLGQFVSGSEAYASTDSLSPKSVRPTTTFRGHLTFGDDVEYGDCALSIPVHMYAKTSIVAFPTAKKSVDGTAISHDTTYRMPVIGDEEEDAGVEVEKEELVRAYRYGKKYVPMTEADDIAIALKTSKSMQIIGFVSANKVPRHYYMDKVFAVIPDPSSKSGAVKLSALAAAMHEKECVAITRYVRTDNSSPKLCVLVYMPKGYLYLHTIPYKDDIRQWAYPVYDFLAFEQVHAKSRWSSATIPQRDRVSAKFSEKKHVLDARLTTKQKVDEAMDGLIDAVDFTGSYECVWPKNVENPGLKRVWATIVSRALDPGASVLGGGGIEVEEECKGKLEAACARLKECFTITHVPPKPKKVKGMVRKAMEVGAGEEAEFSFLYDDLVDVEEGLEKKSASPMKQQDEDEDLFSFLDF